MFKSGFSDTPDRWCFGGVSFQWNDPREHNNLADACLKQQVMGREVTVAVTESKLNFEPWEQIFYEEFDGCYRERVLIKIIGE